MKQTIIRLFSLLLLGMVAMGVQATPFKNIFVTLEVSQPGAGTVYLEDPSSEHHSESPVGEYVELKATLGEDHNDGDGADWVTGHYYYCILHAKPNDDFDFVAFARKKDTGVYSETDYISRDSVFKVNVNVDREEDGTNNNYDGAHAKNNWPATPDHQFCAIFRQVKFVTVTHYQPWLAGEQDDSFGTWTKGLENDSAQLKLTAIPAEGMKFVCWRDENGQELTTNKEFTVDNVASSYKAEFNLAPLTLPAELSTYSNKKQTRYDNWNGEDLTAYKVTAVNDKLTLVKVRHANPGEGVILQGVAGQEYEMSYQGLYLDEHNDDNLLKGTANGSVDANGKIYVLATGNNGVGFYKLANGQQVPPNKAYLEIDDASSARDFIGFDDGTTTSISSVAEVEQTTPIYNMAGQRVSSSFSGLVIQNGRKYIRK